MEIKYKKEPNKQFKDLNWNDLTIDGNELKYFC